MLAQPPADRPRWHRPRNLRCNPSSGFARTQWSRRRHTGTFHDLVSSPIWWAMPVKKIFWLVFVRFAPIFVDNMAYTKIQSLILVTDLINTAWGERKRRVEIWGPRPKENGTNSRRKKKMESHAKEKISGNISSFFTVSVFCRAACLVNFCFAGA